MDLAKKMLIILLITLLTLTSLPINYGKETNENKNHTTHIEVYDFNPVFFEGAHFGKETEEITISKGQTVRVGAALWVDNRYPKGKHIKHELLNWNNTVIKTGTRKLLVHAFPNPRKNIKCVILKFKDLEVGDYTMNFTYNGNPEEGWPPATKTIKIHVIPNPSKH